MVFQSQPAAGDSSTAEGLVSHNLIWESIEYKDELVMGTALYVAQPRPLSTQYLHIWDHWGILFLLKWDSHDM
jgi:hypothetical protein